MNEGESFSAVREQVKYIAKTLDNVERSINDLRSEIQNNYVAKPVYELAHKDVESKIAELEDVVKKVSQFIIFAVLGAIITLVIKQVV